MVKNEDKYLAVFPYSDNCPNCRRVLFYPQIIAEIMESLCEGEIYPFACTICGIKGEVFWDKADEIWKIGVINYIDPRQITIL